VDQPRETTGVASAATTVSSGTLDSVQEQLGSSERLKALSDGVFAIILTILVLELKVPPHLAHASLLEAFHELRPTLIAWVISFLITGMYWVAHRDIFARVRTVNRDLVWLNLLFLLPCALIPFAASVLGEYPEDSRAIQLYGGVLILGSLLRLSLYWYVVRHPDLLWPGALGDHTGLGFLLVLLPIAVYLVAMAVAVASPGAAAIIFLSVPAIYFLAVTVARDRGSATSEAEDFS
jgi:uncharacterized membrane protein